MKHAPIHWDDLSDLWNRPGYLIRRLHQIQVAMFLEECVEFSITPVQFGVLTVLYDEDSLDQGAIATQLGVDRNTVADVIRRLERRSLLIRLDAVVDRRTRPAKITAKGKAFVESVQPAMERAQRRFIEPLRKDEQIQLMELMRKLVQENNEAGRAPLRPRADRS
jgi:DNA-binding MarR family transcriptional regulator